MTTLGIEQVRGWRPSALDAAADDVGGAAAVVDTQVVVLRGALERALEDAGGLWARAAAERAAEEVGTGVRLADALEHARDALRAGAADLGAARTSLLERVDAARAAGFGVGADGSVTAPTLPPVMTSPEGADAALAARNARQEQLNARAGEIADGIGAALGAVADADADVAGRLGEVPVPQSLHSAVDAYVERALTTGDLLGALGSVGAGGAALLLTLKKAGTMVGKTRALLQFFRASTAPITDYATFARNLGAADDAMTTFSRGAANGGLGRFVMGSRLARVAGRAFLPLTVATGALDVVTGGGHDGARGWATRGFGLAGAAGAGTLLASSAGLVALGPVGLGIAGVAVVGYGLWSAGSYVYDHWDDITAFGSSAVEWTGERWDDATEAVDRARDWAGDRLSDAGDTLRDAGGELVDRGRSVVSTMSLGLLG